jgi:hypothetical protein
VQRKSGKKFRTRARSGFQPLCTGYAHQILITGFGFRQKIYYSSFFSVYTNWGGFGALFFYALKTIIPASTLRVLWGFEKVYILGISRVTFSNIHAVF